MNIHPGHRTRKWRVLAAALAGLITIMAFGAAGAGADTRIKGVAIRSGAEIDYPPFSFVDADGRACGFSVELLRAALGAMGRDVTFPTGIWADVRGWLERGEIDALPLVGRTPERERVFDFTFPYMTLHGAIVVRKETTDIRTLGDLKGRKVAVMRGDNAEEFLRREDRGIEIHTTASFEEAFDELSHGRQDAVVVQRLLAVRLIQVTGLKNLKIVNQPVEGFRQDFCFAVREGDRETLALLNEGLALVMADGTYRHLHAKWFAALELPSTHRIVIGGDDNYPPFEYIDKSGRPAGYNVDLTRAIARELGLDIEIRLGPWADIRNALARGEIDALQGMFYSPQRDLTFDFTPPHTINHCVGVVRKTEGPPPAAIDDLAGKRIVVQRGDIMNDFLVENGLGGQISLVDTQEDALRELAQGRYDCALVSRLTAFYWIKKEGWKNLTVGSRPLLSAGYCYAVPQNHKALLAELGEGLKIIEETGEYRRIYKKWMGIYEDPAPSFGTILRYVALVAVPLLLLLLASFLWTRSLRRQVTLKTMGLEESEKRFRRAIEEAPFPIMIHAEDGQVMTLSQTWKEVTGYAGSEIATIADWASLAYGKRSAEVMAAIGEIYSLKGRKSEGEFEITCSDGSRRIWDFSSTPLGPLPDGRRVAISMAADITELRRGQERIQHLNNVLRAIRDVNQLIVYQRNPDALIREGCRLLVDHRGYNSAMIVITDEGDRPVSWVGSGEAASSESLNRLFETGELPHCCDLARSGEEVALIDDRRNVCGKCAIADMREGAKTQSLCARLVHEGAPFGYLVASIYRDLSVDDEERHLFTEIAGDIAYALYALKMDEAHKKTETERISLERQFIHAQKLESVGRLAGGVAHDYNNMLSVIIGYAELTLENMAPSEPLRADICEILTAAQRSADITRQLLAFARQQTVAPRVLDLNETVESMFKMLRRLIGEDIDLTWHPRPGLWPVKIDPTQIDQVLANLCVNARDAIIDIGKVTIETDMVTFEENYCSSHAGFLPGDYVMLAVSDTGCGMDRAIADRIFEPFFTTKGMGRGTGLGLATVYGIIKQNEGFINVYSEPGKGTTFKIYLPRNTQPAVEGPKAPIEEIQKGQGEFVLVVEDEILILKLTEKMLLDLGYSVLLARTPAEALDLAVKESVCIELLITDVVMPEMNGRELAERLQRIYPKLQTLFMSGYTANVIAHRGVLKEGVNFIQKPFSKKNLAAKIRAALD